MLLVVGVTVPAPSANTTQVNDVPNPEGIVNAMLLPLVQWIVRL